MKVLSNVGEIIGEPMAPSVSESTAQRGGKRANAPVFVIGCHRSGTALLYDSLLSAGGFPLFHASPYVHTALLRICGNPSVRRNREKLIKLWLRSKAFRRTGLAPDDLRSQLLEECKSGGDFLRIVMGELARRAGVQRWVVRDCDNIMYIPAIKQEIPDALFVHVLRDGRDAALSMKKQHGAPPRFWARDRELLVWALLWQFTVRRGRHHGQKFPDDYIEVRYEDLVLHPEKTLSVLGEFLEHDLDYGRIQRTALGHVAFPNTVWKEESGAGMFNPVNRWKSKLAQRDIQTLEATIGDCLEEFTYPLTTLRGNSVRLGLSLRLMRILYPWYFESKLFLQSKTLVGRLAKGTRLELADPVSR
jgi:Sulfotransferase family